MTDRNNNPDVIHIARMSMLEEILAFTDQNNDDDCINFQTILRAMGYMCNFIKYPDGTTRWYAEPRTEGVEPHKFMADTTGIGATGSMTAEQTDQLHTMINGMLEAFGTMIDEVTAEVQSSTEATRSEQMVALAALMCVKAKLLEFVAVTRTAPAN